MSKKRILLAEDDKNLGEILKEYLQLKGYDVNLCENGEKALDSFLKSVYDLCLLDVMMPIKDGFTLAKEIKNTNRNIPIIFLTAKSMQDDIISGLKLGADDYITKPFNTEELLLRINAVLNRTSVTQKFHETQKYSIGKYEFNYNTRELELNTKTTILTHKEAELLKLLCDYRNDILHRDVALNIIWKNNSYFTSRSMDVYITKLRRYLKSDSDISIENIHGIGFKLNVTN